MKKGFATSAILYTMLLLFTLLLISILSNLQNKKTILDGLKKDTINALEQDTVIDALFEQIEIMNNKIVALEKQNEEQRTLMNTLQNETSENKLAITDLSSRLNIYALEKNIMDASDHFSFQTRWETWETTAYSRQSILIFGSDNNVPINGLLIVWNNGTTKWTGEGELTFKKEENGRITVQLPIGAYDNFVLISSKELSD